MTEWWLDYNCDIWLSTFTRIYTYWIKSIMHAYYITPRFMLNIIPYYPFTILHYQTIKYHKYSIITTTAHLTFTVCHSVLKHIFLKRSRVNFCFCNPKATQFKLVYTDTSGQKMNYFFAVCLLIINYYYYFMEEGKVHCHLPPEVQRSPQSSEKVIESIRSALCKILFLGLILCFCSNVGKYKYCPLL